MLMPDLASAIRRNLELAAIDAPDGNERRRAGCSTRFRFDSVG